MRPSSVATPERVSPEPSTRVWGFLGVDQHPGVGVQARVELQGAADLGRPHSEAEGRVGHGQVGEVGQAADSGEGDVPAEDVQRRRGQGILGQPVAAAGDRAERLVHGQGQVGGEVPEAHGLGREPPRPGVERPPALELGLEAALRRQGEPLAPQPAVGLVDGQVQIELRTRAGQRGGQPGRARGVLAVDGRLQPGHAGPAHGLQSHGQAHGLVDQALADHELRDGHLAQAQARQRGQGERQPAALLGLGLGRRRIRRPGLGRAGDLQPREADEREGQLPVKKPLRRKAQLEVAGLEPDALLVRQGDALGAQAEGPEAGQPGERELEARHAGQGRLGVGGQPGLDRRQLDQAEGQAQERDQRDQGGRGPEEGPAKAAARPGGGCVRLFAHGSLRRTGRWRRRPGTCCPRPCGG